MLHRSSPKFGSRLLAEVPSEILQSGCTKLSASRRANVLGSLYNDGLSQGFSMPRSERLSSGPPSMAIVGATGAVGQEMLAVLEQRRFVLSELRLLASARSAGKTIEYRGEPLIVRELSQD